jgi:5-formyltetrahydrofolate cyclo-ligase
MRTSIKRYLIHQDIKEVRLTKEKIRSKILLKLKTQKEADQEKKSKVIQKKLFCTLFFKKAKIIMFYVSFAGEVNTAKMIQEAQNLGKTIAVPICSKIRTLRPCLFKFGTRLRKGPYGVYEPAIRRFVNLEDLDLVIVPGLAFDKKGNRLGRGKGYYDRFLKELSPKTPTIGLAFNFQILPSVPTTPNDTAVDKVIFA